MTFEEFNNAIVQCVKDPDKLTELAEVLTTSYKEQADAAEAYKTKMTEYEEANNKLRDANADLVIKVLHNSQVVEDKPEKTRAERVSELTKKFLNQD